MSESRFTMFAAVHEAGHAVTALCAGIAADVQLRAAPGVSCCKLRDVVPKEGEYAKMSVGDYAYALLGYLSLYLGGSIATAIAADEPNPLKFMSGGDIDLASSMLSKLFPGGVTEKAKDHFRLIVRNLTGKLREPPLWTAVCNVAIESAKTETGEFSFEQVKEVMERWMDLPVPSDWLTASAAEPVDPATQWHEECADARAEMIDHSRRLIYGEQCNADQ